MSDAAAAAPPGAEAWRRFRADRPAFVALVYVLVLAAAALIGPLIAPFSYDEVIKSDIWRSPLQGGHLLGADSLGRDLLARTLVGLRVSLAVGVVATAVALAIGVTYGAVAGLLGGAVDELMMRVVDLLYALPFIFFVILLTVALGKSLALIFLAIGAVEWLTMARIVRGQTLSLKAREFVEAARAVGVPGGMIVVRHIAPNLLGPVLAYITLTIPSVMLAESFLSFLGLGVQEPLTSLGTLVAEGAQQMEVAPWLLIFPALVMSSLLLALNLVGEGLREALDVTEPGR
ncbi:ABC transporter permease [Phenylobacterium sp.]|uniref:ABC transporter permease n=1 Tax=Phenylobacterium sp. TaxID=1871053 RepID=UPI0025FD5BD8|nr:ABC transporter permease [Phenylobacterium sp.]MBX3483418.1 ABC transporter permease [Phenylobacterium sp.]MCW5759367.1 ABC transporter permease [Phenylobacterium sp.]